MGELARFPKDILKMTQGQCLKLKPSSDLFEDSLKNPIEKSPRQKSDPVLPIAAVGNPPGSLPLGVPMNGSPPQWPTIVVLDLRFRREKNTIAAQGALRTSLLGERCGQNISGCLK